MKAFLGAIAAVAFIFAVSPAYAVPTTLTAQSISETAAAMTYANADNSNGNRVQNQDGKIFLHLKNPGGSTATVTITPNVTTKTFPGYGPMAKAAITVTLLTTQEKFIGPFPESVWTDSSGWLQITYGGAGAADVDIAALRLSQ